MMRNVTDSFRWFSFRQDLHGSIITTAGVVIAVLMATICAAVLYQSRVDAMDRAAEASRNVALLAERDIERTFELYALSLQAAVEGMSDPEVLAAHLSCAIWRCSTGPQLRLISGSMLVLDAEGSIPLMQQAACRERLISQTANISRCIETTRTSVCMWAAPTPHGCVMALEHSTKPSDFSR